MKKGLFTYVVIGILAVLTIGGMSGAVYYYNQAKDAETLLKNPEAVAKKETKEVVDRAGKLLILPDEEPQMATVLDVEKLKDQPFFKQAQNGDKILVFPKAQKAVLYRASTNIIVEVSPFSPSATPSAVSTGTK